MQSRNFEHQSQDSRQSIAESLASFYGDERPTEALRRRVEREEAGRQGHLRERRAA